MQKYLPTVEVASSPADLNHWMFESSPDCVKLLDLKGRLTAMNRNGQQCMEIDDFSPLCGAEWSMLWPEESRQMINAAVERARGGTVGHVRAFCPTAKGTPKWWDVSVTPVLDQQGRVEKLLSVSRDITAVYESQQELREVVSRLQFTLEASEIGEWDLDLVTGVVRTSLRHDQCYGYTEPVERWSVEIFLEHVHPAERDQIKEKLDAALREQTDWSFECRVIWPDASVHWISAHGSVYYSVAGKPTRMVGVVSDITRRKRAETLAAGQKKAFELAVGDAPLSQILDTLARASELAMGETLLASILLFDPEQKRLRHGAGPSLPQQYNHAIDGVDVGPAVGSCGTAAYLCEPVIVSDIAADPRWAMFRDLALPLGLRACWSMPILSSKGTVLGTLASYCREPRQPTEQEWEAMKLLTNTAALILQQRHESEERRSAEERARLATEAAGLGVWTWDIAADRVTWENDRMYEITGLPQGSAPINAARFASEFLHPEDVATFEQALSSTLETAAPLRFEGRYRRPDGTWRWIELTGRLRPRGDDKEPLRMVGIVADLTERKQTEDSLRRLAEELAETDRRRTEFLATLAHELRNPLAPIRTGLEVMRLSSSNPAAAARTREMMERQLVHMVHLVDDLLDVARISRGKLELKKERIELKKVVTSAVETSLPLIEAGCHDLSVTLPEDSLPLDVDPTRIAQVLSNLLNNAAKYTPAGGRIDLTVRREADEVLIAVSDTGVGLPPEGPSKVFQMFTQLGRDTSPRAQGGLGIGLTLVRRLVELHGGSVTASSPGLGRGSTFTVRLPLVRLESPKSILPLHEDAGSPVDATISGLRVLLVDDNVDAAETLAALLGMIGYTTQVAHDGPQAIEMGKEFLPDVVFLDIGLPGMDGYEVARLLRQTKETQTALLVALTGWGAKNDRARSKEAGFDHHLTKPADLAVISKLLSSIKKNPGELALRA